tara:strand:- start:364 stop:519 length:156 start_codon:yes stop_codon:yes gene_type:complete
MKNLKKREVEKSKIYNIMFLKYFRHRNMKERLARSEFKKYFNRMKFGDEVE